MISQHFFSPGRFPTIMIMRTRRPGLDMSIVHKTERNDKLAKQAGQWR